MAKPKAPLFGLGASGQIGKAIVYGSWKGIDVAREYVVPANPKTAGQSTQRGYMTDAVSRWHTTGGMALDGDDKSAWNRYASVLGPMSGYNAWVKVWVAERVAGGTPGVHLYDGTVVAPAAIAFEATTKGSGAGALAVTLHLGTSRTFFPYTETVNEVAGLASFGPSPVGFAAGERVYFWVDGGTPGVDYFRSGLYSVILT